MSVKFNNNQFSGSTHVSSCDGDMTVFQGPVDQSHHGVHSTGANANITGNTNYGPGAIINPGNQVDQRRNEQHFNMAGANVTGGATLGVQGTVNVKNYQAPVKPTAHDSQSTISSGPSTARETRNRERNQCECKRCGELGVCCQDSNGALKKMRKFPDLECIVQHSDFSPICLTPYVLARSYNQNKQSGSVAAGFSQAEKYRSTAKRDYLEWVSSRVDIAPSCVQKAIDAKFPDTFGNDGSQLKLE